MPTKKGSKKVTKQPPTEPKKSITVTVSEFDWLKRWGEFAYKAGLIPKDTNILQAMAIVKAGQEMGLQPLQSLRMMSFIKGRLTMSVQLQLAMAKQHGVKIENLEEGKGFCKVTLVNQITGEKVTTEYTLEDAQKAGLVREDSNWKKYERQMLRWRTIGDALRLLTPNTIMGLLSPEEAESIEGIDAVLPPIETDDEQPTLIPNEAKGGD